MWDKNRFIFLALISAVTESFSEFDLKSVA